ncbi:MAG: hypothetical protein NZ473_08470 [Candidatus Kapabacteria bacterium]|nr:hypothetical protein [Candidatus Kapabacteria bacterium]MDW8226106.1 hypothetical protein [Bacteroidota bacterium]
MISSRLMTLYLLSLQPLLANPNDFLWDPREHHLRNVRQLTSGGKNAEAYFSFGEDMICFQASTANNPCDQIFIMDTNGRRLRQISPGYGRTTCSYFLPDGRLLYATTHLSDTLCPPPPDRSRGYVWPIYATYDIVIVDTATGALLQRLSYTDGYDAEATVSPRGDRIVFTSARDGDLELYSCNLDGSNLRRLTFTPGYDGGAFFSFDGSKIVYRSHHPTTEAELAEYQQLLRQQLVRPDRTEIFVMDADGTNVRQVTHNGASNFAPFFHPDGRRIIFSSNMHDPTRRTFSLYIVNIDGTGLRRVTYGADFDSFPMFSRDGRRLLFCSSRGARHPREFNIFIADWIDNPPPHPSSP